jgi:hypothetical protein
MANLHIDYHNDNMSQQYLRVKVYLACTACTSCQNPKLTKIVKLLTSKLIFFIFLNIYGRRIRKPMNKKSLA